ncbi:MAG: dicarboxylate/amino acid:cation symporter [Arachidicoccus sp.]|nr:dicarboxylate/amino acid:cation symporter [Arachidicoccus sp.]
MGKSKNRLTYYILAAMVIGACIGYAAYLYLPKEKIPAFAEYANLLTTVFLRLVQMIIAPLVFCTLTVGIAKLGDIKAVGRVGGKAMLWFIAASVTSLFVGLLIVHIGHPGTEIVLNTQASKDTHDIVANTKGFSAVNFFTHLIPKSLIQAMSENEVLQIVIFSVFLGIALASMGNASKSLIKALETLSHAIIKMVSYIMYVAPIGVLGSLAATMAQNGPSVFKFYGGYLLWFLVAVILLWAIMFLAGFIILKKKLFPLLKHILQPMFIAFSTTSSEAVFPVLTEELEKYGCNEKIVSFVLPLGYSFNLDGSMIYMTFASIAISQAYQIHIDTGTQITMLFVLMLTSKGIAGVPRAALVVVAATCGMFKIPPEGIALLLPIDHFCDMFRTMTNVVGNALSTSVVSKWEKALKVSES